MQLLQPLNLPPYPFKLIEHDSRLHIFDELRKKQVVLTPEEWVRQHIVQYLIKHKNYPRGLIKLEGGLRLNGLAKRTDVVAHAPDGGKLLLVECKAPEIKISARTFEQAARYNMVHKVQFLAVSNGLYTYCAQIDFENGSFKFLTEIPDYKSLVN